MSLNNQGRIRLERSGPWIGVAGLFVVLWIAVASSQFAPWWGVVLFVMLLIPGAVLVLRWARPHPKRAAWVPVGNLVVWAIISALGLSFCGWEANPAPSSSASRVLAAQCATRFDSLRNDMGENPGQSGTALARRWDDAHAKAASLSKRAEAGDCPGTFDVLDKQLSGIERLIAIVDQFDMMQALARVEDDFDLPAPHAADSTPLPTKLRRAFETLRVYAPLSDRELGAKIAVVEKTNPLDRIASTQALTTLRAAALANDNYRQCQQALEVIASYPRD